MMKRFSPLMIIHLSIMILLMIASAVATVMFFGGVGTAVEGKGKTEVVMNGFTTLFAALTLGTGALYIIKGYSKKATFYYKTFLLFLVGVTVLSILLDVFYVKMNILLIVKSILYSCKAILLILLALWKDLGKKKNLLFFHSILFFDITGFLMILINMMITRFDFVIMGAISAMICDVAIGLAVKGKYADKAARGSK